jgi:periplasmic protein TonB
MRTYTLVFSIVAHMIAVGALIIAPALATDDLPEPYRTTAFVLVRAELPPPVPPIRRARPDTPPAPSDPVPLVEPVDIRPEPIVEPLEPIGFDLGASATGIEIGGIVTVGDPVPPPPPPPARPKKPVRVGGVMQPPTRLVHVNPIYPPLALAARKEGIVILEALIGEDGSIRAVKLLRPAPLFEEAAIAAVRQWRFSPTLLNGEPVPLVMTVTVAFTLQK